MKRIPQKAETLFESLQETCLKLDSFPERGHIPPELARINVVDFLEIHFYKKDYEKIKGLIKQYPEIKFIEKFYFIYRLWNDN